MSMPPTKVCPQCKAAVPVRWKTCERCNHVFPSEGKAECNLREKAMKRMRAVESDSVKSARKISCTRLVKERQKFVNELCIGSNKQNAHGKHESRDSLVSTQVQSHALMRRGFGTSVPFILTTVNLKLWRRRLVVELRVVTRISFVPK